MQIETPEQFLQAVNTSLMYMNRAQRKAFKLWVHSRVQLYDFNYPNGVPLKETTNEARDSERTVNNDTSPISDDAKLNSVSTVAEESNTSSTPTDSSTTSNL